MHKRRFPAGPWELSTMTPNDTRLVTVAPNEQGVVHNDMLIDVLAHGDECQDATAQLVATAPDLLNACETCERAITYLIEAAEPTATDWLNVRAARHLARVAVENALCKVQRGIAIDRAGLAQ